MIWKTRTETYDLTKRGLVMGILNVTPDSFSDGGKYAAIDAAIAHAKKMADDGAGIIDIGGESTRPGARAVDAATEIQRVVPVIEALKTEMTAGICLSIDTMKAEVAARAIDAGASIINDVSGLRGDAEMAAVASSTGAGVVVMHMQGTPRTMQVKPEYDNVVSDVRHFFKAQHAHAIEAGIEPDCLIYDPGIGFGKSLEHNLTLLQNLEALAVHDRPLLVGVSRKSFIGMILDSAGIEDRLWPTVALTSYAREHGAHIVRVHDVKENADAMRMTEAILHGCPRA